MRHAAGKQHRTGPITETRLHRLAAGIAIVAIVLPIAVTCWHLTDYYGLEHGAAVWITLSDWAGRGTLIPPVAFEGQYAGTRYMPLPIMSQRWLADLVGNEIAGGRLVSIAGVLALVAALLFAFRRAGLSWAPGLLLVAGLMMTPTLSTAIVSIRNDAMPAALQLVAVVLLADRRLARQPRLWLLAGALAGLAVSWKASAIWCIAAVVLCAVCQFRRLAELRRHYLAFCAGLVASLAAGAAFALIMTQGRIVENFRELMFSSEYSALDVHLWVKPYLGGIIFGLGLIVPLVFWGLLHPLTADVPVILKTSIVSCVAFTTLIFVDYQGAYVNHLVDPMALGLLGIAWAVGGAAKAVDTAAVRQRVVAVGAGAAMILSATIGSWYEPLRSALRDGPVSAYSLGDTRIGPGQVLSENPLVNYAIGQQPVIADPFAFRRIASNRPEFDDELIRRIQRTEFPAVVMLAKAGRENGNWYRNGSWGDDVLDAVCGSYHPVSLIGDGKFELYLPGEPTAVVPTSPCNREALRYD